MSQPGVTLHPGLFRKKPIEVQAVQWGGGEVGAHAIVEWITTLGRDDEAVYSTEGIEIRTLEGTMVCPMAVAVAYENDFGPSIHETPEARYDRLLAWVEKRIIEEAA